MKKKIKINKNIFRVLGIFILSVFSFYYTNKMVDLAKTKDPIMQEILKNQNLLESKPIDAIIENNYIIPGLSGVSIDINESYNKMKKLGSYNENLYIFISELPKISIEDNYDKFVIRGNKNKKEVSLVFKFTSLDNIEEILNILKTNEIIATFFIDGKLGEENINVLQKMINDGHYLANYGYKDGYNKKTIKYTNALIERITDYNNNYCYVEEENNEILNICKNLQMHTIKPFIVSNTFPYVSLKQNLENGMIFSLDTNKYVLKELNPIIKYVKQKGYTFVTIEKLLDEKN